MLTDTTQETLRLQVEQARKQSAAEKVLQVREMTNMVILLSRRAIARANPSFSKQDIDLHWVELNYGAAMAANLRDYLNRHATCNFSTP